MTTLYLTNAESPLTGVGSPTDRGHRLVTQCLYPSFDRVCVFVHRSGPDFVVSDGGGAARVSWVHGRDSRALHTALNRQAAIHHLRVKEDALISEEMPFEWLRSGILSVANASAAAARQAVEIPQISQEKELLETIRRALQSMTAIRDISDDMELTGKSGKKHKFDFGVKDKSGSFTLIDTVTPHHVSVAAKYVAFSDTSSLNGAIRGRFIVHDKPLERADTALLSQFADIVPSAAVSAHLGRHFAV